MSDSNLLDAEEECVSPEKADHEVDLLQRGEDRETDSEKSEDEIDPPQCIKNKDEDTCSVSCDLLLVHLESLSKTG